jgi:hypothetical protein
MLKTLYLQREREREPKFKTPNNQISNSLFSCKKPAALNGEPVISNSINHEP